MKSSKGAAIAAWLLAASFYFYQYVLRSSPGVMVPQLSEAFGLNAAAIASLLGLFYYGYAPFSLVAGAALDRFGPKTVIPIGALAAGLGALLFASGNLVLANFGRFLQGAGGVFALIGAVYIVTEALPDSPTATLIGATQVFGSSGASAGQFLVGPIIAGGIAWSAYWMGMGIAGVALAVLLFLLLPKREAAPSSGDWLKGSAKDLVTVFKNPQSLLCGLIAGLLFVPTTIFDMIWGVPFLQEAHRLDFGDAVIRSAMVPTGWLIGCPLMGAIADRLGRRKPVIIGGSCVMLASVAWILYGPPLLPPYSLGLILGVGSGVAMIPYTVIKEANPRHLGGTSTGVVGFINFTLSALLGPVFGWIMNHVSGGGSRGLEHYQFTFQPLLYGIAAAVLMTLLLKETGPAARVPMVKAEAA